MTTHPLYHQGSPVTDADFEDLSIQYKLPFDVVAAALSQAQLTGAPDYDQYGSAVADKVRAMFNTFTPTAGENDPLQSEEADIVDHAAISLMQAITHSPENSFLINEHGFCSINPAAPPSLIKSYEMVAQVIKLRELGPKMDDKTSWMLGSVVDELETLHGEAFELSQVCKSTEKAYNTVWTAVKVYQKFKKKHYRLSFTHHKEALFQKIGDDSQHLLLHKAELYALSAKDVRALGSIVKLMDDDQVVRNIRSRQQAEALIDAHKDNKVTYLIYDEGAWSEVKGTAAAIPTGKVVLDLKNKTARANNGQPIDFKKPCPTKKSSKN